MNYWGFMQGNQSNKPDLGFNIKRIRQERGLSIKQLSDISGLPQSTMSKVENGKMSLNFDKLLQLAESLEIDIRSLFARPDENALSGVAMGRRTIERESEALTGVDNHYTFQYLCRDFRKRLMIPVILDIQHDSFEREQDIPMMDILGERYAYVLDGPVEFHCEQYEPVTLATGDSLYVDAAMPHAFVNPGTGKARVLTMITSGDEEYLKVVREVVRKGESDASEKFKKLQGDRS